MNLWVDLVNLGHRETFFAYTCTSCFGKTFYCRRCNKVMDNLLSSTFFKCCTCKLLTKIIKRESVTIDDIKPIPMDSDIKNLFQNDNRFNPGNLFTNNSFMFNNNSFIPKSNNTMGYLTNNESTFTTPRVNRTLFISPDTRSSPSRLNNSGTYSFNKPILFHSEIWDYILLIRE
jgi:hypothetical protein